MPLNCTLLYRSYSSSNHASSTLFFYLLPNRPLFGWVQWIESFCEKRPENGERAGLMEQAANYYFTAAMKDRSNADAPGRIATLRPVGIGPRKSTDSSRQI